MNSRNHNKYDVLRFIKRYVKDYSIISNGKEISVNCHWCSPKDYKKKFTINSKSGLGHCWKCNETANFYKFSKAYGKTTEDLGKFLLSREFSGHSNAIEIETQIPYPEDFRFLADSRKTQNSANYFEYLYSRGLTDEDIDYYSLGYCHYGKLYGRVVVPVFKDEKLVSYIARTIGDAIPKVLTPKSQPGTHGIKDYVFNLERAKETKLLYVGEGVFDAIALGVHGICLFGKEATKKQIAEILNCKPRRIVVCLDGDAYKYSLKLASQLMLHCKDVRVVKFHEKDDPASLPKISLEYHIANAKKFDGSLEIPLTNKS